MLSVMPALDFHAEHEDGRFVAVSAFAAVRGDAMASMRRAMNATRPTMDERADESASLK